jgi:hypothetical protein
MKINYMASIAFNIWTYNLREITIEKKWFNCISIIKKLITQDCTRKKENKNNKWKGLKYKLSKIKG